MNILLRLEYDGAAFHGWQRQNNALSVQEELERALTVYACSIAKAANLDWNDSISLHGSGRTDAGVHARAQAANFHWPTELPFDGHDFFAAVNGISCHGVSLRKVEIVPEEFHARKHPHIKRYTYKVLERPGSHSSLARERAWVLHSVLDMPEMIRAAKQIVGTHDFSSFRASDCGATSTVRTISLSEISRNPSGECIYTIEGKGFLKQMVRVIVGTLVEIGRGERSADSLGSTLLAKQRSSAGITAPAHGLYLDEVRYLPK